MKHSVFFLLAALAVSSNGCVKGGPDAESASADHPLLGSEAPAFQLKRFNGAESLSPGASRGKVTIVDFWATWCAPCKESFPAYEAIAKEHPEDVVVIAISEDEKSDGIAAFVAETGVTFPVAWDEGQQVASQYDPSTMPTSYILDRNGIVRYVHVGFNSGDEETLRAQVVSLLE
ncbi:MAG: TlpA family protein disulfide reductase [Polyangiaceae bacterium]|nr:TlpA family protein disulfide reductase [Polyangiaceae bacterium]